MKRGDREKSQSFRFQRGQVANEHDPETNHLRIRDHCGSRRAGLRGRYAAQSRRHSGDNRSDHLLAGLDEDRSAFAQLHEPNKIS